MKHTTGPWHTEIDKYGDEIMVYAHPNKFICKAIGSSSMPVNIANAKLIAAAPDLFEALVDLLEWSRKVNAGDEGDQMQMYAEQAIKKAQNVEVSDTTKSR